MDMDFEYLQIENLMLQTLGAYKGYGKMGSFVKFPGFLPELQSLDIRKKYIFVILC